MCFLLYIVLNKYLLIYWAHWPPGLRAQIAPPGVVSSPGPDHLFALIFSFVFSGICIKFWFQIWDNFGSFHIILASLFRGWILHGFVIDFWTDFDLIVDVLLIRFPFTHLPCKTFKTFVFTMN